MHKFEIFNRISQELEINRGKEEQEQSWHCRLAGEFSFQVQDLRRSCGVLQRSIPVLWLVDQDQN